MLSDDILKMLARYNCAIFSVATVLQTNIDPAVDWKMSFHLNTSRISGSTEFPSLHTEIVGSCVTAFIPPSVCGWVKTYKWHCLRDEHP